MNNLKLVGNNTHSLKVLTINTALTRESYRRKYLSEVRKNKQMYLCFYAMAFMAFIELLIWYFQVGY